MDKTIQQEGKKPLRSFKDLDVWKKAHFLVLTLYKDTANFPTEEKFGLVSQLRRAVVSVPANIAEGFKRISNVEKIRFYNIAQSSLEEVRYFLLLSRDLGYSKHYDEYEKEAEEVAKMLAGLIKSISTT